MKYLKGLWIATLVISIGYFIKNYLESGFDGSLFASVLILLSAGLGFWDKK